MTPLQEKLWLRGLDEIQRRNARAVRDSAAMNKAIASNYTVDAITGCHLWNGSIGNGYPYFRRKSVTRAAILLATGEMPDHLMACHHCDTPRCINADHLYAGTAKQNAWDCINRHSNPPHLKFMRKETLAQLISEKCNF